jgi:uncharacterized protein (TIGR03083 family)
VSGSLPGDITPDIRAVAAAQVEQLAAVVAGLSDADLVAPTRCAGWLAAHLLVHVRLGFAEHALSFAEPAGPDEVVDRDFVSYWRDWPASASPATYDQVRFYWANGSAYATADSARRHVADTARQAAAVSRRAPSGLFRFQGHVMAAEDILAMWTVEWVIHQLDLTAYLPGSRPAPTEEALALAVLTLDGLTGLADGGARPSGWDDSGYVLKATGRVPLSAAERGFLGERAAGFPAFG